MSSIETNQELQNCLTALSNHIEFAVEVSKEHMQYTRAILSFLHELINHTNKVGLIPRDDRVCRGLSKYTPCFSMRKKGGQMCGVVMSIVPNGGLIDIMAKLMCYIDGKLPKIDEQQMKVISCLRKRCTFYTYIFSRHQPEDLELIDSINLLSILNPCIEHKIIDGVWFSPQASEGNMSGIITLMNNQVLRTPQGGVQGGIRELLSFLPACQGDNPEGKPCQCDDCQDKEKPTVATQDTTSEGGVNLEYYQDWLNKVNKGQELSLELHPTGTKWGNYSCDDIFMQTITWAQNLNDYLMGSWKSHSFDSSITEMCSGSLNLWLDDEDSQVFSQFIEFAKIKELYQKLLGIMSEIIVLFSNGTIGRAIAKMHQEFSPNLTLMQKHLVALLLQTAKV